MKTKYKNKQHFLLSVAIACINTNDGVDFEWTEMVNGKQEEAAICEFYGIPVIPENEGDADDVDFVCDYCERALPDESSLWASKGPHEYVCKRCEDFEKAKSQVRTDLIQLLKELAG